MSPAKADIAAGGENFDRRKFGVEPFFDFFGGIFVIVANKDFEIGVILSEKRRQPFFEVFFVAVGKNADCD